MLILSNKAIDLKNIKNQTVPLCFTNIYLDLLSTLAIIYKFYIVKRLFILQNVTIN